MEQGLGKTLTWLGARSTIERRLLLWSVDCITCVLSCLFAYGLRIGALEMQPDAILAVAAVALPSWALAAWIFSPYRSVTRYLSLASLKAYLRATTFMASIMTIAFVLGDFPNVPRTLAVLQPLVFLIGMMTVRTLAIASLRSGEQGDAPSRVVICGCDETARHLAAHLIRDGRFSLMAFIDPEGLLAGRLIDGRRVHAMDGLEGLLEAKQVDEIFVTHQPGHRRILRELSAQIERTRLAVRIRHLPSTAQIVAADVVVDSLKPVDVEDLLGRQPVPPLADLLTRNIRGNCVTVTGAGGSIGSELCRQIVRLGPRRLVLAERGEYNLYAIHQELTDVCAREGIKVEIVAELVDVADEGPCARLFDRHRPDTLFHAAAYKHVPLVESNVLAGVENNLFGTLLTARHAERVGTATYILISTDKAVRPTNVMGASKRACELVIQARAASQSATCFSAVRFGNVLGSSGSVIPRFREQLASGGPITLTHRDVTRYFMTIPEAALLVIQAGAMAQGGDLFLLDMGEPVRIRDLAESLVRLSGLQLRSASQPDGDIEIVETGLRPGEKLFEELLIADNPLPTEHPRIVRACEDHVPWPQLDHEIQQLAMLLRNHDEHAVRHWLSLMVAGYDPKLAAA